MNIVLDVDGVLSNWLSSAAHLMGVDLTDPEIRTKLKTGRLEDLVGKAAMWSEIGKAGASFWENLAPLPWCQTLFVGLQQKVGGEHVFILTAPSHDSVSASSKIKWCRKHLKISPERIIITPSKWMCARKDTFLIDDTAKQVNRFKENGGGAYLWPNPLCIEDGEPSYGTALLEMCKEFDSWASQ